MFRAIGCMGMLLVAVLAGWYLRGRLSDTASYSLPAASWQPITGAGASRASDELARLERGAAPFVVMEAADLAAHVFSFLALSPDSVARDLRVAVDGSELVLHATVDPGRLGLGGLLEPIAAIVGDSAEVWLRGSFTIVRPGLAQLVVSEARIGTLPVPDELIPRIARQILGERRPAGVSTDAIPVTIPDHIQDIRISEGRVLVYRRPQ